MQVHKSFVRVLIFFGVYEVTTVDLTIPYILEEETEGLRSIFN